jgi:type II secretory pathway pseudopilin PulG
MAVEPEAGGLQTIYVTDMSSTPLQVPNPVGGWTSTTGACSSALYQYRYRYSEKDPRKLITVATFTISTGNNEEYFVAPGNGVADVSCEVSGVSNNAGVGGTVSLSCTRTYAEGDIINFFLSSAGGSSTSIVKAIINIK